MNNNTQELINQIIISRKKCMNVKDIAERLDVSKDKVKYIIKRYNIPRYEHIVVCKNCDGEYKTLSHSSVFCTDKCRASYNRKNLGDEKLCIHCNTKFNSYKNFKYCSINCRREYEDKNKKKIVPIPKKMKLCINCNEVYYTHSNVSMYCSKRCRYEYNKEDILKRKMNSRTKHNIKCKECSSFFVTTDNRKRYCSKECKNKFKNRTNELSRRIMIKNNGSIDRDISIERLLKRDGHYCYICNEKMDSELNTNDDYYPSIEHVKALANGGTHTWNNVKLAHRKCNWEKGIKELK